jgi:hypothetical protein
MLTKIIDDKYIAGYTFQGSRNLLTEEIVCKCASAFPSIPKDGNSIYLVWLLSRLDTFCTSTDLTVYLEPHHVIYRYYWSPELGLLKFRMNLTLGRVNLSTKTLKADVSSEILLIKEWEKVFKCEN